MSHSRPGPSVSRACETDEVWISIGLRAVGWITASTMSSNATPAKIATTRTFQTTSHTLTQVPDSNRFERWGQASASRPRRGACRHQHHAERRGTSWGSSRQRHDHVCAARAEYAGASWHGLAFAEYPERVRVGDVKRFEGSDRASGDMDQRPVAVLAGDPRQGVVASVEP